MKRSEIFLGLLRIPFDFIFAIAALFAAYYLRLREDLLPDYFQKLDLETFPDFQDYLLLAIAGALIFIILLGLFKMYSLRIIDSFAGELRKIFSATLIWLMSVITYYFLIRDFPFSRLVLFYGAIFLFIFIAIDRIIIRWLQKFFLNKGIGRRRVVLVGKNIIAEELLDIFSKMKEFEVIDTVQTVADLEEIFLQKKFYIEEVIQTQGAHLEAQDIIDFCREHHLQYHFVPDLLEVYRTNVEINALGGIPLISLRPTPLDGWGKVLKRTFDFISALIGLVILSPALLFIAIAIKLDSPGTVFFRFLDDGNEVKRVGEKGRLFTCLKFRTMKAGTHNLRYTDLADNNTRKNSPLVKIKNDPRVTRVGKILRRFSLDELPNLWNVIKGDMSLVGPRPHLPEEVARYQKHHKFVLTIKPGITGMAQISGRSDLPFEEEVRLDSFYIEHWSLRFDLKILAKTLFVVFKGYKE